MRYGVCDTSPTHRNRTGDVYAFWDGRRWNRRTTSEHVRAGLPGWVYSDVVHAKLSDDPATAIAKRVAEYLEEGRFADAGILKDQARAFELIPHEA